MQSDSGEGDILQEGPESIANGGNKLNGLSQVITKGSVAAAGINVDTPIVSAIIGNLTGTLPTKKKYAKQVKCKICNCRISSYIIFQKHINGAKHQRKLKDLEVFTKLNNEENNRIQKSQKSQPFPFMCEICPLEVNSAVQLQNHLSGERHRKKAVRMKLFELDNNHESQKSDKTGEKIQLVPTPGQKVRKHERGVFACYICNILLNSKTQQSEHMNSKKHKIKEELRQRLKYSVGNENAYRKTIHPSEDNVPCLNSKINSKENLADEEKFVLTQD